MGPAPTLNYTLATVPAFAYSAKVLARSSTFPQLVIPSMPLPTYAQKTYGREFHRAKLAGHGCSHRSIQLNASSCISRLKM